jgi:predicted GNAT family N-acyltransferase
LSTHSLDDQPPTLSPYVIRQFNRQGSASDFERALALRIEVFVEEQAVPIEEEQDEADDEAMHWLILDSATLTALCTARMVPYQEGCQMRPVAKIGRVAVKKTMRGKQLGALIMGEILATVQREGYDQAILDAQVQVIPFYEKLGFVTEGEEFLDAGIRHYRMRSVLR